MSLIELRIENLRCIESAGLEFSPELNLITGENGAGKTSILEAIFLLGRGRSFRTRNTERLIRYGQISATAFGRTDTTPAMTAGIEVSREKTRARISGANANSLLELSGVLPVQAIDPEIHKLIDQGPERRRRWLDWLVFHVEPTFGGHWVRYQRALKQRNAALRAGEPDVSAWDPLLIDAGTAITKFRQSALARLSPHLQIMLGAFAGLDVEASFQAGWASDRTLPDVLSTNLARDRERGITHSGPHRADVVLRSKGRLAREILSRGQQKVAAVALIVSQLRLLRAEVGLRATLLLDDPAAELDPKNVRRLFGELRSLECQMIATSLTPESTLFQAPNATFHVEQGRVIRL